MANTTKLKPRRVNSFNEPSDGKNLWYKNDDQFKWQDWWWWHQSFFKTQSEYDALPASKESDGNLYIIVDNHLQIYTWGELESMWSNAASTILNSNPQWYADYYLESWDVQTRDFVSHRNSDNPWHQLPTSIYIIEYNWYYDNWWYNCGYEYYKTDATAQDLENLINSWYESLAQQILSWTRHLDCLK